MIVMMMARTPSLNASSRVVFIVPSPDQLPRSFEFCRVTDCCNPVKLENAFFDIVHIEEEIHFARWMAELRDVGFKIFLNLRTEVAQAQATHFIIPFDDRSLILLRRVFSNPAISLFIG